MESNHAKHAVSRTAMRGRVRLNPEKLKIRRYQLGFSQSQLAIEAELKRLPLSISTIKRAELGAAVILRSAQHLSTLLETTLSYLQDMGEPEPSPGMPQ